MSDRTALLGPITSALLVLSAITGHFVVNERVGTHRPVVATRGGIALPGGQNVDARLWQDPLAAVLTAKSDRSDEQALKHLTNRIREHTDAQTANAKNTLTILPVFIPGGDYAEDSEVRRRYRVAVVSALMTADLVPSSTEHIGSFPFQPVMADGLEAEPMPIPYEWYERSRYATTDGHPKAVLVLWLPERALGSDPLLGGEHVVCEPLIDLAADGDLTSRKAAIERLRRLIRFRVIGPSNSNTLAAMVESLVNRRVAQAEAPAPIPANNAKAAVEQQVGSTIPDAQWSPARRGLGKQPSNTGRVLQQAFEATERHRKRLQMKQPSKSSPSIRVPKRPKRTPTAGSDKPRPRPQQPPALPEHAEFLLDYLAAKNGDTVTGDGGRAAVRDQIVAALSPNARILSPRATVPDKHLLDWASANAKLGKKADDKIGTLTELFRSKIDEHVFTRTNCTDDQLALAVVNELTLRGIDPKKDRIALILERDSLYGRTLESTFEAAILAHRRGDASANDALNEGVADTVNVEVFSYLRGIDGITPATSAATPRAHSDSSKPSTDVEGVVRTLLDSATGLPPNHAFGPNQFDRVLQLAETIAQREAFQAIGIVGSDIYDKLAILQALEPRFPDHVFFTTDLDARLVPNELTPFTKNLVVVSGFGHELEPRIQRDTGAFRDSYQSAIFLATLVGVGDQPQDRLGSVTPRVFEMGRTRPIEFKTRRRSSLHPPIEPFHWNPRELIVGSLFALFALAIGYLLWVRVRRELSRLTTETVKTKPYVFLVGMAVTVTLFVLVLYGAIDFLHHRQGEPFYWTQGVSMWPTEIVRIAACAAGVVMLRIGIVRIRHSDTGIGKRYFGTTAGPSPSWPGNPIKLWLACSLGRADRLENPTPLAAWQLYRELGQTLPRLVRITPYLVLALGAAAAALLLEPAPRPPYRGDYAYWVDFAVGSCSVLITVFLALAVADSARLSNAFVRALRRAEGAWPDGEAARVLTEEHALRGQDLAEHLHIDVTCQRTAAVGRLFWYPFAVLALMVFGQYSTFDAWHWPLPFLAMMFLLAAAVFVTGILLLRATHRTRDAALARMHHRISRMTATEQPKPEIARHARLLAAAKEIDTGAFSGLRSPMVDAVLLPSGGLAVLSLLELMAVVMAN